MREQSLPAARARIWSPLLQIDRVGAIRDGGIVVHAQEDDHPELGMQQFARPDHLNRSVARRGATARPRQGGG